MQAAAYLGKSAFKDGASSVKNLVKNSSNVLEGMDPTGGTASGAVKDGANMVNSYFKSDNRKESNNIFKQIDLNNDKSATQDEIYKFVSSNDKLWAMLGENLDLPHLECKVIATRVAMELASGLQGDAAMKAEIDKDQFHQFRKRYMLDKKGNEEFFHRAVFATFDRDNNNQLDEIELEDFLDIFYKSNSIFAGDAKLPPKHVLKRQIMEKFDDDGNGSLDFEEIRLVIAGEGNLEALPPPEEPKARSSFDLRGSMNFSLFKSSGTNSSKASTTISPKAASTTTPPKAGSGGNKSRSSASSLCGSMSKVSGTPYKSSVASGGGVARSTSLFKMDPKKESNIIFKELDANNKKIISKDEVAQFVASKRDMWNMLSVKLGRPKAQCQSVATRVAMELASGKEGPDAMRANIDKDQFHDFRKKYILADWGSNEFFYRTIFATFDIDHDNGLNDRELDEFLEIFYQPDSAFKGANMPPKMELKKMVLEKYDDDGNGLLEFEEIRQVIKDAAMFAKKKPVEKKRQSDNRNSQDNQNLKEQEEKEKKKKREQKKAAEASAEEFRKWMEEAERQKEIEERQRQKEEKQRLIYEEEDKKEQEQLAAIIEGKRRAAEARLKAEAAARKRNPKTVILRLVVRMFVPPKKQNTAFNYADTQLVSYRGHKQSCIIL